MSSILNSAFSYKEFKQIQIFCVDRGCVMDSGEINYNFLLPLNVPQKLKISHNLIEKLLGLSENMDKSIADEFYRLTPHQKRIYTLLDSLANLEEKFYIAKIEYDKKYLRFLQLTPLIEEVAEKNFNASGYILTDVDFEGILKIIDKQDIDEFIIILERNCEIINDDIKATYNRINAIMSEWKTISNELLEKIKNFEYRGMKYISARLRVKITPILAEMQESLRAPFTEDATSRNDLIKQFEEIIEEAKEDIFGNLSQNQLSLYNHISDGLTESEIVSILKNSNMISDLIELMEDGKIEIKLIPKIQELF